MYNIYRWNNLVENSPSPSTRNEWLWSYGAFARYNELWFPCRLAGYTTIGEPAFALPIPIATINTDMYSSQILCSDLDVLYSSFRTGQSLELYVIEAINRKRVTEKMLDGAIRRSLNTELITSPKRLIQQIKQVINNIISRGEIRIIDTNMKDDIHVIELPHTANLLEKLWNSHDWAVQEISQLLGISYNPTHGKKERVLRDEMRGDRDLVVINREYITSRLTKAARLFGEECTHMSDLIDVVERRIDYENPENNRPLPVITTIGEI